MPISTINSKSIAEGTIIATDILDGTISSSKLVSANIAGDRIAANTLSNTVFQTGSVESYLNAQSGGALGARNRIINGDMRVSQYNSDAAVTPTNGGMTLDRWKAYIAQSSKFTVQKDSSANTVAGFTSSLKVTSLSAYSVTSTDEFNINQAIEGLNFADLNWGTANAAPITVSFWVRSSLTGTFGGCVRNYGISRSYPISYTIVSANTWEKKTITIPGDTTGTWAGATTAGSTFLTFSLGAGSTLTNTPNAWAAGNFTNSTGATSVVGTNGATWYITGVQLEKGSIATPFEYRQYGAELQLCQRYYELFGHGGAGKAGNGTVNAEMAFTFQVTKRASPSIAYVGSVSNTVLTECGVATRYVASIAGTSTGVNGTYVNSQTSVNGSGGVIISFPADIAPWLSASAEL